MFCQKVVDLLQIIKAFMKKSPLNINKQFMIGNGILAFAVIVIVGVMVYVSLRAGAEKVPESGGSYAEVYTFRLDTTMAGDDVDVYLNDSLIFSGTVGKEGNAVSLNRFATDNTLMLVDRTSDIVTPYSIADGVLEVTVGKDAGELVFTGGK